MTATLICGDSSQDTHYADLVCSNVYGPLPLHLRLVPMLVSSFSERQAQLEHWTGVDLHLVSRWNRGRESVWAGNVAELHHVDLEDLLPEPPAWYPLELPLRLLARYGWPGAVVWDGFCGRGTVGRAAIGLGMHYVGIDRRADRIELARAYLADA